MLVATTSIAQQVHTPDHRMEFPTDPEVYDLFDRSQHPWAVRFREWHRPGSVLGGSAAAAILQRSAYQTSSSAQARFTRVDGQSGPSSDGEYYLVEDEDFWMTAALADQRTVRVKLDCTVGQEERRATLTRTVPAETNETPSNQDASYVHIPRPTIISSFFDRMLYQEIDQGEVRG